MIMRVHETAADVFGLDLVVFQRYAYITNGDGLAIFDLSDPSDPQIEGSVITPGEAKGLCLAYPYVYITEGMQASELLMSAYLKIPRYLTV